MNIKTCKIDKLTIVANLKGKLESDFQWVIDNTSHVSLTKSFTSCVAGTFFSTHEESIYFEYDGVNSKAMNKRNFRIEFNPSKISSEQSVFIKKEIMPLLTDVGFSRIDIALDVTSNLADFHFEATGRKRGSFSGRDGKLETMYIGSRRSEKFVRVYDKKNQLLEVDGVEIEDKVLWRLEYEIKGSVAIDKYRQYGFDKVVDSRIIKYDFSGLSATEKIFAKSMIYMPNDFSDLSRTTKHKIRKKMKDCGGEDVAPLFRKEIEKNNPLILAELKGYEQNCYQIFQK